jgi:hypothetical protein
VIVRRTFYRFRRIAPNRWAIFVLGLLFLLVEGGCRYLESKNIPVAVNWRFRPAHALLVIATVLYGVARAVATHPIWNPGYQIWLESTPWVSRKPLPMGPVELVWEDGLILGPLLLLSALLPEPRSMQLICAFLLRHLLILTATLFLTRAWAIAYASAFALGLAVWLWRQPLVCLVASTLVYLMAYDGLRRGFDRFPWKRLQMPNADADLVSAGGPSEMLGWPYDRMLREVVSGHENSGTNAVLCCMLGGWWLFVLSSFVGDPGDRQVVLSFPFIIMLAVCPAARLYVYMMGYIFPITFWARIRTGRWIIPGYDQVFVAPICSLVVGPLSLALLRAWSVSIDLALPIATGLVPLVALVTPPSLKRWRLTGQHRIVHAMSLSNPQANTKLAKFVKVG